MKGFLRLLFAPCSEISRHTSMCLDHELPRAHRIAIRFHHLYCTGCRRYGRHIRFLRDALREFASGALPPEPPAGTALSAEAKQRLKRVLSEQ